MDLGSHTLIIKHTIEEENEENSKEPLMLTMITNQKSQNNEIWYIDSSSSNHMTGHRDWLVNFDEKNKSTLRFADNKVIRVQGTWNVLFTRQAVI